MMTTVSDNTMSNDKEIRLGDKDVWDNGQRKTTMMDERVRGINDLRLDSDHYVLSILFLLLGLI